MNIKLILMDLDGTLFGQKGALPEINIKALRECERRDIRLALVSGRGFPFIKRTADRIGINCAIVSANGARIEASADGPCIFEGTFEEEEGRFVMNAMIEADVNFEAYSRDVNYVYKPELMPERHARNLQMNIASGDITAEYDEEIMKKHAPHTAYKFVAFARDEESFERTRGILERYRIRHCSSASGNLEVMPKGIDKGLAVRRLSEYFHIDRSETMAFGDYTNDIDMLTSSGHPVAMMNAVDEVKAVAEFIAPLNTEGGLGKFIFENIL